MLVLLRQPEQSIIIDDNIVVLVTDVRRNIAQLRITAPRSVAILRGEIAQSLRETVPVTEETGCLSLGRRVHETIVIGDNITITVIAIAGRNVRLGFDAPHSVPIHRHEVYEKIQSEVQPG